MLPSSDVSLASTLIASTPTTIHTVRGQRSIDVHLVNDDPSQTIDVSVYRTFDDASVAARMSDEQFTGIAPGECRVGRIESLDNGVQLIFRGVASGAGNAPLRNWFSQ